MRWITQVVFSLVGRGRGSIVFLVTGGDDAGTLRAYVRATGAFVTLASDVRTDGLVDLARDGAALVYSGRDGALYLVSTP